MNILSEADFDKLRATGMLYVVEPDCDGTYESYLKRVAGDAMPKYRSVKIRVRNKEHSEYVQKVLFEDGCRWVGESAGTIWHMKFFVEKYLFVDIEGFITYMPEGEDFFGTHSNNEVVIDMPKKLTEGIEAFYKTDGSHIINTQEEFLNDGDSLKIYGAARGGGKSTVPRACTSSSTYKAVSFDKESLKAVQNAFNNPSDIALRPKHIVAKERMKEILEAMGKWVEDGKRIPVEWLEELGELSESFGSHV